MRESPAFFISIWMSGAQTGIFENSGPIFKTGTKDILSPEIWPRIMFCRFRNGEHTAAIFTDLFLKYE